MKRYILGFIEKYTVKLFGGNTLTLMNGLILYRLKK